MKKIIRYDNIQVQVEAVSWQEAIQKAGHLLVKNDYIYDRYIDNMIQSVNELGAYIVLTPGFAFAHAAPSEAVKKTGMSLITLKDPINFGSINDPVKVVLCLACVNKSDHLEKLQTIAGKLMGKGVIDKISTCSSNMELYSFINS